MVRKTKTEEEYQSSLASLEHELIHILQDVYFPGMPIEAKEYEAYVAGVNVTNFKENPQDIEWLMFGYFVTTSVDVWYKDTSIERGEKIEPPWKNPEYFLKNVDGVGEAEIEKYKVENNETKAESGVS